MKAATQDGRCICADQCGGNSRGEHAYNLDEFMVKLRQMLAALDPHDVRYSPGEWDKVWLGPNSFVVFGKFWDDFYVTEEVAAFIHSVLSASLTPYDIGVSASFLLHKHQALRASSQGSMNSLTPSSFTYDISETRKILQTTDL